jgi:hypothetical protein
MVSETEATGIMGMPPGAKLVNGRLMRLISREVQSAPGETKTVEEARPVALSLGQAQRLGWDYFSPKLGWIRGGVKTERDHPIPESERFTVDYEALEAAYGSGEDEAGEGEAGE